MSAQPDIFLPCNREDQAVVKPNVRYQRNRC